MEQELDFNDSRVLELLRQELDRREYAKQQQCSHLISGTMKQDRTVKCDACGKTMGKYEVDNAFAGDTLEFSPIENKQRGVY